ncbi:hypothetical protein [Desulfomicrobium orale]|uniref:hypothetical protein n=1 Tax=Desulfomicrobium orale TaxID=132132 RepID=UPI0012457D7F|nr:hypothetical protein [Desulfomicrobium orale]
MQKRLIQEYTEFKEKCVLPAELQDRLSPPLLIKVPEKWERSDKRVLVIGQETLGWSFQSGEYYSWPFERIWSFKDFLKVNDSVQAMIHAYQEFEFAKQQPENYRSPFWRAYREIRKANKDTIDGIDTTVLWSNLFRMSLDCGSVIKNGKKEEIDMIRSVSSGLLLEEIKILKPTSVIFFTGPHYNETLYKEFGGIVLEKFMDYETNHTAYLNHPVLPKKSIRTYHPGYLNRGHWDILDKIIEAII